MVKKPNPCLILENKRQQPENNLKYNNCDHNDDDHDYDGKYADIDGHYVFEPSAVEILSVFN